jgi:hypothetical protein
MTITTSATTSTFGTDPVAAAVRATMQSPAFRHADRSAYPPVAGRPLDIDRLYPALSAPAPSVTAVAAAHAIGRALYELALGADLVSAKR